MRTFFVLLAILFVREQVVAEQIFLLYGEECGTRLRYERSVDNDTRMDYFAYSLPAGFGMRLVLETDGEGASVRRDLPDGYLKCSDARLTPEMADRINEAQDHLFLVRPTNEGGYRVEPVVMAAVLEEMGTTITYRSPFATFSFDPETSVIGVNLDEAGNGATVTFEGLEGSGCRSSYLLRQYNPEAAYPYIIYRLVPGLGIVERRLTGDGRTNVDEVIRATTANDQELTAYLDRRCATKQMESAFVPLYIEPDSPVTVMVPEEPQRPSSPAAKVVTAAEAAAPGPVTVHEVIKGETLYSIARRYGVSVTDLQRDNGLGTSTIFVGQQLTISSDLPQEPMPSYAPAPVTAPAEPDPVVVVPPAAAPEPAQAAWPAGEYHTVQKGETFASLALRYGYTTQRFKEFNEVGDAAVPFVGQRLRTTDCVCPSTPAAPTETYQSSYDEPVTQAEQPTEESTPATYGSGEVYPAYPAQPTPVTPPTPNVVAPPAPAPYQSTGAPATPTYSSPPPPAYGTPTESNRAVHIVREGESMYGIARQYRVTVEELLRLNDLQPADVIVPYQKLYVN